MAEQVSCSSKALKHLENQLTCPVCLEHFTAPKTLPCLHSFCHDCLDSLPVTIKGGEHFISCPTCRHTTKLPDDGAAGFQSAFHLNSLLDVHELLNKVTSSQQLPCGNCEDEQANGYCSQCEQFLCQECINMHKKWKKFASHEIASLQNVTTSASKLVPLKKQTIIKCTSHNKPLEVYCDTCERLICQLCTVGQHRNHQFDPMSDVFPKHKQQILEKLQPVEDKLVTLTTTQQALEKQESELVEQNQAVKREINNSVQQLIKALQLSKRKAFEQLDKATDAKVKKLTARKKPIDIAIGYLQSVKQFTNEELRIGSPQQILVMKRQMLNQMKTVLSQAKEEDLQSLEETKVSFLVNPTLIKACGEVGRLIDVHISGKGLKTAMIGRKASFDIHITEAVGTPLSPNLLSCQLTPAGDSAKVVVCDVCHVTGDQFKVTYCSPTLGSYLLLVKVGGANIPGSPFTVHVLPSPEMHNNLVRSFTGLDNAMGVAVTKEGNPVITICDESLGKNTDFSDEGDIVVGDTSQVIVLDPINGKEIRRIGKWGTGEEEFKNPCAVAVTNHNNILVADTYNHRLQMFTSEGDFITLAGSPGSGPLQFIAPFGVAVHSNGKVFISDAGNNRVQVLNSDLTFSHCFGSEGEAAGQFRVPMGIAIDSQGMVYVADCGNSRVQKLTPEGKCVAIIGSKGLGRGQFKSPGGLCIDSNDIIYITDGNKTVSMFNTDGQFLGHVGTSGSFTKPRNIAVDFSGRLYIANHNKLLVY